MIIHNEIFKYADNYFGFYKYFYHRFMKLVVRWKENEFS